MGLELGKLVIAINLGIVSEPRRRRVGGGRVWRQLLGGGSCWGASSAPRPGELESRQLACFQESPTCCPRCAAAFLAGRVSVEMGLLTSLSGAHSGGPGLGGRVNRHSRSGASKTGRSHQGDLPEVSSPHPPPSALQEGRGTQRGPG